MSHDLTFVIFFLELLFFLANGKWQQMFQYTPIVYLLKDFKYRDINQENKIYW